MSTNDLSKDLDIKRTDENINSVGLNEDKIISVTVGDNWNYT